MLPLFKLLVRPLLEIEYRNVVWTPSLKKHKSLNNLLIENENVKRQFTKQIIDQYNYEGLRLRTETEGAQLA